MSKLKEAEAKLRCYMISAVMVRHAFNTQKAAHELEVSRGSLNENIRRLGLTAKEMRDYAGQLGDACMEQRQLAARQESDVVRRDLSSASLHSQAKDLGLAHAAAEQGNQD